MELTRTLHLPDAVLMGACSYPEKVESLAAAGNSRKSAVVLIWALLRQPESCFLRRRELHTQGTLGLAHAPCIALIGWVGVATNPNPCGRGHLNA